MYVRDRSILTNIENRLVVTMGEGGWGVKDWEFAIRRKLLHVGWINKKVLLCSCCCRFSHVQLCVTHRQQPTRLPHPWDSLGKNTGVGCHFVLQCMKVKSEGEVAQSCPTLCDPMDCSLPGSSIQGIFQARVLEWGAIAFSILYSTEDYIQYPVIIHNEKECVCVCVYIHTHTHTHIYIYN